MWRNGGRSATRLRAGLLDELRPAGDVFLHEGAEFLRGVADRLEAEAGHAGSDFGVLHGGDEEGVELLDDGARGAGGDEDAVPAEDVEAGRPDSATMGRSGAKAGALDGGDGEAAELSCLDLRKLGRPTVNMTWSWPVQSDNCRYARVG